MLHVQYLFGVQRTLYLGCELLLLGVSVTQSSQAAYSSVNIFSSNAKLWMLKGTIL
jgi:hypothetical protein